MTASLEKIFAALEAGGLVLTSNKRLARHLLAAYDRELKLRGAQAWKTPRIFSLDAWFDRMLVELGESWRLLQGAPAKRLWEQIIEADSFGNDKELLQLSATAEKARQAAQLLHEYRVSLDDYPLTQDQWVFHRWHRAYHRQCAAQGWLDRSALSDLVLDALARHRLRCPTQLILAGFDQGSPVLTRLGQVVAEAGGLVEELVPYPTAETRRSRHGCRDPRDEIEQAARWTRALLERGATSIGIVVSDLQARRGQLERIFRDQIDPAAALRLEEQESAFSLSLGAPLIEQGLIHAALEILAVGPRLTLDQASFLLRTPYLKSSQTEADRRALCDARLRSFRQQSFRLERLIALSTTPTGEPTTAPAAGEFHAPAFARCLRHLAGQSDGPQRLLPGEWAARFDALLRHPDVGWPGERSLASSEYQMLKAWQDKLLPTLASLDSVSPPIERRQALALLRRLAAEIEFQLEAPTGPVQVLGLLESAGLEFEHLWVMGANEQQLPAAARPNPFLPIALQVAQQMPHASAERELDFAKRVVARLQAAGREVVFSYALRDGDCELRPSPLILELPQHEPLLAEAADPRSRMLAAALPLESLSDTMGPPLETERGQGGTGLLKDQALCPFRAFAHYRLRGKAFERAEAGLDAMTRGNLLHRALEIFWDEVRDQHQLLRLQDDVRQELVLRAVRQAQSELFDGRPEPQAGLLEIEQQRQVALIEEWLCGIEQSRIPFQVLHREMERLEQIGSLQIKTIIDRIDRLEDGSLVVLDYKTGAVDAELLIGERLLEPQLPIYAITNREREADGVAFAQLRRGGCKLVGVTGTAGLLPKVEGVETHKKAQQLGLHSWSQLLAHWRAQLETLAGDFVAGVARVDPVDEKQACRYCDLAGLCRIAEAGLNGGEE